MASTDPVALTQALVRCPSVGGGNTSGRDTRDYLGEKAREGRARAAEAAAKGREALAQGRETLSSAIDRGREAYQQARARDEA